MAKAEWKWVSGYKGLYRISSKGRIRSVTRKVVGKNGQSYTFPGVYLSPYEGHKGYLYVNLSKGAVRAKAFLHRLVADHFIPGGQPKGSFVCHRDGNPQNNRVENLKVATHKENEHDKRSHGTTNKGANQGRSKLTAREVGEIRSLYASGVKQRDLCRKFGIAQANVSMIVNRVNWNPDVWIRDAEAQMAELNRAGSDRKRIKAALKKTLDELAMIDPTNPFLVVLQQAA